MSRRAPRRAAAGRTVLAAGWTSILAPVGASFLLVAVPDLRRGLSVDGLAAGTVVTAYFIVMVIGQPVGGRIGDRFGRARALRAGTALLAAASVLGALAPDFQLVLVARAAQAIAGSLAFPNAFAMIRNAVPAARRGRVMGGLGASLVVAGAAAIPLGQLIVQVGGWRATFFATAVLALLATALQPSSEPQLTGAAGWDHPARAGTAGRARAVSGDLAAAVVSLGATNAAMYAFLVATALGASGRTSPSVILFLFLAGSAIGAGGGGRVADRVGRGACTASGLIAMLLGLAMLLRPVTTPEWVIGLGTLIAGVGVGAAMTGLQTFAADVSGATVSGRAAGWLASGRYLGAAAGSLAASVMVVHQVGGENLAMLSAVIGVLVASAAAARLIWRRPGETGLGNVALAAPAPAFNQPVGLRPADG